MISGSNYELHLKYKQKIDEKYEPISAKNEVS